MDTIMTGSDSAVIKSGSAASAYKIEGSALSKLTKASEKGGVILITDVVIEDSDIALPVVATDDKRVLFKFGKDFGTVIITGRVYLGAKDCKSKTLLRTVQDAFDASRLSKASAPTKVSIAEAKAFPMYPTKLRFADTDPVTNSVGFTIYGILVPEK